MRLDQVLVELFKIESRTKAQALIAAGKIQIAGKTITKPGYAISDSEKEKIEIIDQDLLKYVSRAGIKLESALQHLNLNVQGYRALDIGQSTGGFSDCLLQNGIKQVVGIDVGHGQLHEKLKAEPKCICIENTNVKELRQSVSFLSQIQTGLFDFLVIDASFISLTQVIAPVTSFVKLGGEYLVLVKPQFECGPELLDKHGRIAPPKNGRVQDHQFYSILEKNMRRLFEAEFGSVIDYFPSALRGKEGNMEFFIYGKKTL